LTRGVFLLLSLALAVSACGGDGSSAATSTTGPPPTSATTTAAAPATTATTATGALVAAEGDMVAVHYVGTLDDGSQFDSSRDRGVTLDFTIGAGQMIAGFDGGVRGMAEGETRVIRIEPADAYGEYDPSLVVQVLPDQVPEGVQVGMQLQDPFTGQAVTVTAVTADYVEIDTNHPLAGEALTFEIEMISITR
jgi:FKBP-type peptidyl-prolyl cis-trans isomerase 2